MSIQGWIKLHRKFIEWEWWGDMNTSRFFIYCLLRANHEDRKWRGTVIKRGQFISSLNQMSSESGLTSQQIRTCIKKLLSTHEITHKSTNRFSLITLVNYDNYQNINKQDNKPTNNQITNKQQTNNNKQEYKELKNIKNRKEKFKKEIFESNYPKAMLQEFYDYWSEPNKSGTKFKMEMQKTWDLGKRLSRWASNDFSKNNTKSEYVDESKIEYEKKKARRQRDIEEKNQKEAISDDEKKKILKMTNFKWE